MSDGARSDPAVGGFLCPIRARVLVSDSGLTADCPAVVADEAVDAVPGGGERRGRVDARQSERDLGGPAEPAIQPTGEFLNDRVGLLGKPPAAAVSLDHTRMRPNPTSHKSH